MTHWWNRRNDRRLRRALFALAAAGIAVSAFLLYVLVVYPIASRPTGQHIEYVSPHFYAAAVMTFYLLSATVSPILSTHRMVKLFGVLALLSFGAVYYFYAAWFIAVWCFFAALLSAVVYLHFVLCNAERGRSHQLLDSTVFDRATVPAIHQHDHKGSV